MSKLWSPASEQILLQSNTSFYLSDSIVIYVKYIKIRLFFPILDCVYTIFYNTNNYLFGGSHGSKRDPDTLAQD